MAGNPPHGGVNRRARVPEGANISACQKPTADRGVGGEGCFSPTSRGEKVSF
uniref:Uncharacterized protein n=1 Tax=Setaria italica TaxID=4555 RepID=K4AP50_SETIT